MIDRFVGSFVEKLILLEQKAGAGVSYHLMPPISEPFRDYLSIQTAARKISTFIGLPGLTFIIGVAKQKDNVGGHIDIGTKGKEVFIEVSDDTMNFPHAVGATLSHEICHKWLQVSGIRSNIETDNEILTDITAVFLGLGKIMLNGCKSTRERHEFTRTGVRTITETLDSGYLSRDQLALVYRMVCAMRKIPASDYLNGLNSESIQAVKTCEISFGHCYDSRFHCSETTQNTYGLFLKSIVVLQRELAELDKAVRYVRSSCCETADGFLTKGHEKLESLRQQSAAIAQQAEPDPALTFLLAIQAQCKLQRMDGELGTLSQETSVYLRHLNTVGRHLFQAPDRFPAPIPSMFNVTACPQDGTKLRLPEESGDLLITCPTCKYRFAYNTNVLSFAATTSTPKQGFWGRFRHISGMTRKPRNR